MKKFLVAVSVISATHVQAQMKFEICVNLPHNPWHSSVYNDSLVWEVWVDNGRYDWKPFEERAVLCGIDDAFIQASKDSLRHVAAPSDGTFYGVFLLDGLGIYHFELRNKFTGKLLAYQMANLNKFCFSDGKTVYLFATANLMGTSQKVYSPTTKNELSGKYRVGWH